MRLKYLLRHIDERLVEPNTELLSVSKTHGVVPRAEISDTPGRAEDLSNYKTCQVDDLVINRMSAYQGALGIAGQFGAISPDYMVLRTTDAIRPGFAGYLFKSHFMISEMSSRVKGIGSVDSGSVRTPRLNWSDLGQVAVDLPPADQQESIAAFLDRETAKIDALIAKQEQLITTLDERRKAVISHATKASLSHQGENTDWRLAPLKSLVTAQTGGTPDSSNEDYWSQEGTPWVAIGDMSAVSTVTSTERKVTDLGLKQKKLKAGKPGTVLFAMYASVGATSMLGIEAVWNQAILGLTPKPESINNRFLQFSLEGNREMWKFWSNSNTQENLNQQSVLNAKIAVPSHEEQLRIVQFLEDFERKSNQLRSTAESVIQLLNERRQALISAAVTGKLEVGV